MFSMLPMFQKMEQEILDLMKDETAWRSLYVDYHPPIVERIWRQWGEYRVYLHRIHPCIPGEALFHRHAWPQAVRVISGTYEMGVGVLPFQTSSTPLLVISLMGPGSYYEMNHPSGGHYVQPIGQPSRSVLLTGPPREKIEAPKSTKPLHELSPAMFRKNFDFFRDYYWHHLNDDANAVAEDYFRSAT